MTEILSNMTDPLGDFTMWVTFGIIAAAVVSYALEKWSLELTSLVVLGALILFFTFFPVISPDGTNLLTPTILLHGLGNPALVTILSLLVVGQGLFHSGALDRPVRRLLKVGRRYPRGTIMSIFITVMTVSAFLNNTPVVVIFIPVLSVLAERNNESASKVMIPLSFIAVLGGMVTLIGSSTNMLVAGSVSALGLGKIDFFDFSIPGIVLASVGAVYVLFVAPRFLPAREENAEEVVGMSGKQFIVQIEVKAGGPLVGDRAKLGQFKTLEGITVRMIQRGDEAIVPPFDDIPLEIGDVVIMAATRNTLAETLSEHPDLLRSVLGTPDQKQVVRDDYYLAKSKVKQEQALTYNTTVAEAVVAPGSRVIGQNLQQFTRRFQTGCIVLGIQRRSRMARAQLSEIRLEAGDVLLFMGSQDEIRALRASKDILLLEWTAQEFPALANARKAQLIFAATILAAASGIVPIVGAALTGAGIMIATGCLNLQQAARALDMKILLLVAAALSMGTSMEATGGASYLAHQLIEALSGSGPIVILSALFLLIAFMTNILSNNATAVLFTPIAVKIALELNVDPMIFVYGVIFAANCSFATPMAYQTNLMVMGPGHYKFGDYLKTGLPLILLIWLTYTLFAPWYYGMV